MTKYYRCIRCESVQVEEDFSYDQFCETCNRSNIENSNARRHYRENFNRYCAELFYIRYPEPNHSGRTIPNDDEGKAKMIAEAKRRIVMKINSEKKEKKRMEENNDTSDRTYKETVATIAQLEQQIPLIVNLEQRYPKKN